MAWILPVLQMVGIGDTPRGATGNLGNAGAGGKDSMFPDVGGDNDTPVFQDSSGGGGGIGETVDPNSFGISDSETAEGAAGAAGGASGGSIASTITGVLGMLGAGDAAKGPTRNLAGGGNQVPRKSGPGLASQASQSFASADSSPQFNDPKAPIEPILNEVVNTPPGSITTDTTESTRATLNPPGFGDRLGEFGKGFGLTLGKMIVQDTLSAVPGGKILGKYAGNLFDNPDVAGMFTDEPSSSDRELRKRDNIINMLLKQQQQQKGRRY